MPDQTLILHPVFVHLHIAFLYFSGQKPRYLQEEPRLLAWCLATQLVGFLIVVAITTIGTMLVYYRTQLPAFGL